MTAVEDNSRGVKVGAVVCASLLVAAVVPTHSLLPLSIGDIPPPPPSLPTGRFLFKGVPYHPSVILCLATANSLPTH